MSRNTASHQRFTSGAYDWAQPSARVIIRAMGRELLLAVALAVRAPRLGHVFADLATVAQTAIVDFDDDLDTSGLSWPTTEEWVARLTARDAYGRVRARLKLTPEMITHAMEQIRQGQAVPMKELRDELRARVRT